MATAADLLVLLVEDDLDLALVTQLALERDGMRVIVARDGREGLELIAQLHPDVIVTDLVMPVLDGLGLIQQYEATPPPHVPVIAVSAVGSRLRAARDLGAVEALVKPVLPSELVAVVRKAARRSEQTQ